MAQVVRLDKLDLHLTGPLTGSPFESLTPPAAPLTLLSHSAEQSESLRFEPTALKRALDSAAALNFTRWLLNLKYFPIEASYSHTFEKGAGVLTVTYPDQSKREFNAYFIRSEQSHDDPADKRPLKWNSDTFWKDLASEITDSLFQKLGTNLEAYETSSSLAGHPLAFSSMSARLATVINERMERPGIVIPFGPEQGFSRHTVTALIPDDGTFHRIREDKPSVEWLEYLAYSILPEFKDRVGNSITDKVWAIASLCKRAGFEIEHRPAENLLLVNVHNDEGILRTMAYYLDPRQKLVGRWLHHVSEREVDEPGTARPKSL